MMSRSPAEAGVQGLVSGIVRSVRCQLQSSRSMLVWNPWAPAFVGEQKSARSRWMTDRLPSDAAARRHRSKTAP